MIDRMMWATKDSAGAWVRALTGSTTGQEISGHEVTK